MPDPRQPARSSRRCLSRSIASPLLPLFSSRIQVRGQPLAAGVQRVLWRGVRLLAEHLKDDDGVGFDVIHNAPRVVPVVDPELVALDPNAGQGPRVRQAEHLAALKPSQEESGLEAAGLAERRRLDFTMEPHEWFVSGTCHGRSPISNMTYPMGCWQPAA